MKIRIRYESEIQKLEVDRDEMWVSLSLGSTEGLTNCEMEKRIQEMVDEMFNRPDYNNWHKHDRHSDATATPKRLDNKKGGIVTKDTEKDKPAENTINLFPDFTDEENQDSQYEEEAICQLLRQHLKPDQAELIIQIHIKKVPKQEYAESLGITPSAVSHRLETAEKNFKKIFPTPSSFRRSRGY